MSSDLISFAEAVELTGKTIPDSITIVTRLADAIERLEAGVAARDAELARLRAIATAAQAALAELDAFLATASIEAARLSQPRAVEAEMVTRARPEHDDEPANGDGALLVAIAGRRESAARNSALPQNGIA